MSRTAVDTAPRTIPPSLSSRYDGYFLAAGKQYGISPLLLAAVAKQESGFNTNAVSSAGAVGIMQLMPGTAAALKITDATNAKSSIFGAAKLLSQLSSHYRSVPVALGAYNAGTGAVAKYGGIPPYPETQQYIKSILSMAGAKQ